MPSGCAASSPEILSNGVGCCVDANNNAIDGVWKDSSGTVIAKPSGCAASSPEILPNGVGCRVDANNDAVDGVCKDHLEPS
jgi:hypothetical protein